MTTPSPRLRLFFSGVVIVQGAVLVGVSQIAASINLPWASVRMDAGIALALGSAVTLLGLVSWKLPVAFAVALGSSLLALIAVFALGYRPIRPGDFSVHPGHPPRTWQSETHWTEVHTRIDPRFGWSNAPNAVARQKGREFSVTYRIDADGWRRLPAPTAVPPHGDIWFVGCSYTFGAEVEDDEVFAHRLAARAWPGVRVRNFSVSGWGTTNALLLLQDQLARQPRPNAVLYGWISHHPKRNHLRKSWFGQRKASLIPHFDLDGDKLRWRGLVPGSAAVVEDSTDLDEFEFRLTAALIREMARLCKERGIPFVLLVLSDTDDRMRRDLHGEPGVHVLDVSRESYSRHGFGALHPTRVWHQAVARAIASDPLLARLTGVRELLVPEAIPAPAMGGWGLERESTAKSRGVAAVAYPARPGQPLRVDFSGSPSEKLSTWSLKRSHRAVAAGSPYVLEMRVRSDGTRPLRYALSQGRPPWKNLGLEGTVLLTTEWQQVSRVFIASGDESTTWLQLELGGSTESVEVADEPVIREVSGADAAALLDDLARPGWKLSAAAPAVAILALSANRGAPLLARLWNVPGNDVWSVQLQHDALPIRAGQQYTFELRVRSAGPHPLEYTMSQDHAPWENLGLWGKLGLSPDWQTVRKTFIATRDDPAGRLALAIGASAQSVEIDAVRLLHGERDLLP